jgi:hypothetical protein
MAGLFGAMVIWDHPFLVFPMKQGGHLHLPCGSCPTSLIENPAGITTIQVGLPSGTILAWTVEMTALEVQATFRSGAAKLNRITEGDLGEVTPMKPFRPSTS